MTRIVRALEEPCSSPLRATDEPGWACTPPPARQVRALSQPQDLARLATDLLKASRHRQESCQCKLMCEPGLPPSHACCCLPRRPSPTCWSRSPSVTEYRRPHTSRAMFSPVWARFLILDPRDSCVIKAIGR